MSSSIRILIGLLIGLALGALLAAFNPPWRGDVIAVADAVGGVWLDALKMTIVPLVFALLVTGVAQAADTLQAGGTAGRTLATFCILLLISSAFSAMATPALLHVWSAPVSATAALRHSATGAGAIPPTPALADWLKSFVPDNPVKAAADAAMAPLVFFALMFGLAATKIDAVRRQLLFDFFDAVQATMMVVVGWVLQAGPFGILALALVFGARTGVQGLGILVHYVSVVSLMCLSAGVLGLLVALFGGRVGLGRMVAAMIPVYAVGISTQSSLASLPAMLTATRNLGVSDRVRDLVMPMGVALFRITSPAGNIAVAFYVAHIYGIKLDPLHIAAGVVVAALVSLALVGIASAVTFFTALGPIFLAMGLPMDLLPLFLAVETLPDLSRTLGNVTAHVGVTTFMERLSNGPASTVTAKVSPAE